MQLTVHDVDVPELAARVEAGLDAFNGEVAALRDVRPLSAFAHDAAGALLGGAVGRTWGECCELQQLWVDSTCRRQGLGTQLVRAFERAAAGRGCRRIYLETFSFQAQSFYDKLGYALALDIRGFAPGIVKCLMMRELPPR